MEPLTGPLPPTWQCLPLGDLCTIRTGPSGAMVGERTKGTRTVPLVRPTNLVDRRICGDLVDTAVSDGLDIAAVTLRAGDIVGVRNGDLGRFALVDGAAVDAVYSTSLLRLRITSDAVDPRYLLHYLNLPVVVDWVRRSGTGTTVTAVRTDRLGTLPIAVPPDEQQRRIVEQVELLHRHAELHAEIARRSREVRDELASALIETTVR